MIFPADQTDSVRGPIVAYVANEFWLIRGDFFPFGGGGQKCGGMVASESLGQVTGEARNHKTNVDQESFNGVGAFPGVEQKFKRAAQALAAIIRLAGGSGLGGGDDGLAEGAVGEVAVKVHPAGEQFDL